MQNKFKRHQEVKIKVSPNKEYIEYHEDEDGNIKEESGGKERRD